MLRFKLHQLHVPSLGRYFLPLPKMTDAHLDEIAAHLAERGFRNRRSPDLGKLVAVKGAQRISVDGVLGLASSGTDMLDALSPAIPAILSSKSDGVSSNADVAGRYFTHRFSQGATLLQLHTRLESLRTWTCLRQERLSGIASDEAEVLRHLLEKASRNSEVECVTAIPREGSTTVKVGRNSYYKSTIPVSEFLSAMATIESGVDLSSCYLPRDSPLRIRRTRIDPHISARDVGEWCLLD